MSASSFPPSSDYRIPANYLPPVLQIVLSYTKQRKIMAKPTHTFLSEAYGFKEAKSFQKYRPPFQPHYLLHELVFM